MNTYPTITEFNMTPGHSPIELGTVEKIEVILQPTLGEGAIYTDEHMLSLEGVGSVVRGLPVCEKVDIDEERGDEWVPKREKRLGEKDDDGRDDCRE